MKGTFTLKDTRKAWDELRDLAKNIAQRNNYVRVGVLGNGPSVAQSKAPIPRRRDEEITNVELAVIHEYGAPAANIPERSFIRSTAVVNRATYLAMFRGGLPKVLAHKLQINTLLGLVGAKMAADMKNTITHGDLAPLAPSTIERKGSSRPLVDTGQLLNSITWAVVEG